MNSGENFKTSGLVALQRHFSRRMSTCESPSYLKTPQLFRGRRLSDGFNSSGQLNPGRTTFATNKRRGSTEQGNLVKMRNSNLGQSAPSLFVNSQELTFSPRRPAIRIHRKSVFLHSSPTLPRRHSPNTAVSPLESPKVSSNQLALVNIKKVDGRRWSLASLPSSGYGTTPGSSNVSSQCSSQERLHQIGLPTSTVGPSTLATTSSNFVTTPVAPIGNPATEKIINFKRHFSSNDSNPGVFEEDGGKSPSIRPRSRSLSSPVRTPVIDNEIVMMNTLYKERFPNATMQMEERLRNFILSNETLPTETDISADSVAIVRFVHHQILEMARDCLQKSEEKLVTSRYFYEMSENLEKLLSQTRDKSPVASIHLTPLIKKLLLIVSRPARLLECLEFDPEEFYQLLEAAEGQARGIHGVTTNVPQYIIEKLGLNRDPLDELQNDLSQLDNLVDSVSFDNQIVHYSTPNLAEKVNLGSNTCASNCKGPKEPSENDFETVKLISNGAYGAVYLVRHKETRQPFALKKINKLNLILRNQVDQVFAERDIMSFTDNPFVVSMYCSFETKKHLCMVMEYVEGGDCANLLKNIGPFPPDMARFYFAETVLAVEYLHSFGIVHRDLKPDNLLITSLGHIKLTDFGLSKMGLMSLATNLYEGFIDKETKQFSDKQVFGTPEYIAPEVILRQGYGKPVDWWSMGIILYEFLIGCVPFFGETPEELFAHTVNDDIEWPEEEDWPVQTEAKDIITSLLHQNPLERLGTAGSLEVKDHHYFSGLDWNAVLRMKADFIPQLEDEEDTSYFDMRLDRYNHEDEDEDDQNDSTGEENDETQSMFASFTSASPRYRKVNGGKESMTGPQQSMSQGESSTHSDSSPDTSNASCYGSCSPSKIFSPLDVQNLGAFPKGFRAAGHLSCPDLENMIARSGIPNRALEILGQKSRKVPSSTPDSSQTESDGLSPLVHRRRRLQNKDCSGLPRFSFSSEESDRGSQPSCLPLKPSFDLTSSRSLPVTPKSSVQPNTPSPLASSTFSTKKTLRTNTSLSPLLRSMVKSSSTTNLSVIIPSSDDSLQSPGWSSNASSRDVSPCRDISPLVNCLNPPIIVRRGPRGFGFTIRAIRVYFGDTDFYTVHHLVREVQRGSPAFDAGLRPGDLVTHINGESVQGLFHPQVLQILISGGEAVTLRATALETTTIKTGGRRRDPQAIKLARHSALIRAKAKNRREDKIRRKSSLFSKLSRKKASAEMQQLAAGRDSQKIWPSPSSHSPCQTPDFHSDSSSHGDSSSPSSVSGSPSTRPSSLYGLKHKLQGKPKSIHSPNRRKSMGNIPLSPLARTPSPSAVTCQSPTRSPSPLACQPSAGHPFASSTNSQSYIPESILTSGSTKKSFSRPKSAEPGSPLLRKALSPDRLHPRTADSKKAAATISPLCSPTCKVVVSTSPKLTTSTQPIYSTSNIKAADVSLFSTRPVHPVPLKTPMEPSTSPGQEMMLRKHSKPSLSQPTIPEEGPEHSDDLEPQSQGVSTTPIPVSILRPKPELKVVKNLSQESSGAISKNSPTCSLTKSSHCLVVPKSPKSLKQESVEKLLKAIRGTNRLDTKSQKRENSISPSSHASLPETNITSSPSKSFRRDGMRKNGQDKKDIFKNPH